MNIEVRNLENRLAFLAKVLPPIEYSRTIFNSVSLDTDIGHRKVTAGGNSRDQVAFKKFLEEKELLLEFIINVFSSSRGMLNVTNEVPANIDSAFTWRDTPQGQGIWHDVSDDWCSRN